MSGSIAGAILNNQPTTALQDPTKILGGWQALSNAQSQNALTQQQTKNAEVDNQQKTFDLNKARSMRGAQMYAAVLQAPDDQKAALSQQLIQDGVKSGDLDQNHADIMMGHVQEAIKSGDPRQLNSLAIQGLATTMSGPEAAKFLIGEQGAYNTGPSTLFYNRGGLGSQSPGFMQQTASIDNHLPPGNVVTSQGTYQQNNGNGIITGAISNDPTSGEKNQLVEIPDPDNPGKTRMVERSDPLAQKYFPMQPGIPGAQNAPGGIIQSGAIQNTPGGPVQQVPGQTMPRANGQPAPAVSTVPNQPPPPGGYRMAQPSTQTPSAPGGGGGLTIQKQAGTALDKDLEDWRVEQKKYNDPATGYKAQGNQLDRMASDLNSIVTGPGSDTAYKAKNAASTINGLLGGAITQNDIDAGNYDKFKKEVANWARSNGAAGDSVGQLTAAFEGSPDVVKNRLANGSIIAVMAGINRQQQLRTLMQQKADANTGAGFQSNANKVADIDPRALSFNMMPPDMQKQVIDSLKSNPGAKAKFQKGLILADQYGSDLGWTTPFKWNKTMGGAGPAPTAVPQPVTNALQMYTPNFVKQGLNALQGAVNGQ